MKTDTNNQDTPKDSLVLLCQSIATNAHAKQTRRDGVTKYITHPAKVVDLVGDDDERLQCVAWLHDVIEDTDLNADDLLKCGVPHDVVQSVEILAKKEGDNYHDYLERVNGNYSAKMVKIADMVANLTDKPTPKQVRKYTKGLQLLSLS